MSLIDKISLELLIRVHETGTISSAARQLRLSPSLANRKLSAIEDSLGAKLFVRTSNKAHLTEAGMVVIAWAQGVLVGNNELQDQLSQLRGQPTGTIRFAAPEFFMTRRLTTWLTDFANEFPEVALSLLSVDRPVQLAEERYDLALHFGGTPSMSLVGRKLADFRMGLFASRSYVERCGQPESLQDLAAHKMIRHTAYEASSLHFCKPGEMLHELKAPTRIETSSAVLAVELMVSGAGILCVGCSSMEMERYRDEVVRILPDYELVLANGEPYSLWLLFPNRPQLHRVRLFADRLAAYLAPRVGHLAAEPTPP